MKKPVFCFGEALWDAVPEGLFPGGAPFNAACHLQALGWPVFLVSRVGEDELGRELHRRMAARGLALDFTPRDPALPTGFARVSVNADGGLSYDYLAPAAWDAIECSGALESAASAGAALLYGSQSQRCAASRAALRRLWPLAPYRIFDVNLRPPSDDAEIVRESLAAADLAILNEDELQILGQWYDLPTGLKESAEALAAAFGVPAVAVTRGRRGALLLHGGQWHEHPGYFVEVEDAIGAGDAFVAALVDGLLGGQSPDKALAGANALGAFVASRRGGAPEVDWQTERLRFPV